ncbi:MAG TPA: EamA/RhaT family transporter, partial [Firmicutes bacterium]|nr:EamA/RhaT family transporter [Bacillota bacterium]
MLHRILLLLSALFWGGTFVVVKQAVAAADPILFIGARFLLAAIMLVVIFPRVLRR